MHTSPLHECPCRPFHAVDLRLPLQPQPRVVDVADDGLAPEWRCTTRTARSPPRRHLASERGTRS